MKLHPLEVTSAETSTSPTSQPADEHPDEESLTSTPERRPVRAATGRARYRMSEWIQAIRAPRRMSEIPVTVTDVVIVLYLECMM